MGEPGGQQAGGSAVSSGLSKAGGLFLANSYVSKKAASQEYQKYLTTYIAIMDEWWTKRDNTTLEKIIKSYIGFHTLRSFYREASEKISPANPDAMRAAIAQFSQAREAEIIAQLQADPLSSLTVWSDTLRRYFGYIESRDALIAFKAKVEEKLLDAYAKEAADKAIKSSGKSAQEIQSLADIQVRAIVANHRQDFLQAASNGVHSWIMPEVPSSKWPEILSGGSLLAGSIGSIVTVGAGSVVATAGIGLLIAGIGLGLASILEGLEKEAEAERRRQLEHSVQKETLTGYERISEGIEAQEDVLALLCTTEAIKAGLDLESIARNELREFTWKKMFGDFPEDQTAGREYVEKKMHQELDSRFGG